MNKKSNEDAYRRYAPVYDAIFGFTLELGRKRLLEIMNCVESERVLEIGTGTGLTLLRYKQGVDVTAIDLSPEMLARASRRIEVGGRKGIKLICMDAQKLEFSDASFDKVAAFYVASVAADPAGMLREMRRVCRRGGYIYILNHFSERGGVMSFGERLLKPLASYLGWNPLFYLDEFIAENDLAGAEILPAQGWGYWKIIKVAHV